MTALGQHWPDPMSRFLGTDVERFESEHGIHGQSWVLGRDLHLLTVVATDPGTGQLRRFLEACKDEYESVSVWHIMNPVLAGILKRYGFKRAKKVEPDGE